jgi:hypothetical protein
MDGWKDGRLAVGWMDGRAGIASNETYTSDPRAFNIPASSTAM